MEVSTLLQNDRPEGSLNTVIYTRSIKAICSIFPIDTPKLRVEIEQKQFKSIQKILETILISTIEPHERFSYRFTINYIRADENIVEIYRDTVTALSLLMVKTGIELSDTLISYSKEYSTGSIWLCKKFFRNEIVALKVFGVLSEENIKNSTEYIPSTEIAEFNGIFM